MHFAVIDRSWRFARQMIQAMIVHEHPDWSEDQSSTGSRPENVSWSRLNCSGRLVGVLDGMEIPYRVVGSVASTTYGEPRFTNDIDVVVDLHLERRGPVLWLLPSRRNSTAIARRLIEAIRQRRQFNIIHYESGIKVRRVHSGTRLLRGSPSLPRGRRVTLLPGFDAWFASPEDVILKKLEYYREGGSEKHISDIAGILKVQQEQIDRDYLVATAQRLGLEETWARCPPADRESVTPPIALTQNAVCSQVNRKPPWITKAGITARRAFRLLDYEAARERINRIDALGGRQMTSFHRGPKYLKM